MTEQIKYQQLKRCLLDNLVLYLETGERSFFEASSLAYCRLLAIDDIKETEAMDKVCLFMFALSDLPEEAEKQDYSKLAQLMKPVAYGEEILEREDLYVLLKQHLMGMNFLSSAINTISINRFMPETETFDLAAKSTLTFLLLKPTTRKQDCIDAAGQYIKILEKRPESFEERDLEVIQTVDRAMINYIKSGQYTNNIKAEVLFFYEHATGVLQRRMGEHKRLKRRIRRLRDSLIKHQKEAEETKSTDVNFNEFSLSFVLDMFEGGLMNDQFADRV